MEVLPLQVQRVVDRFIRAFAPERIVLFGSHAKGTSRPDSDYDFLIVANLAGSSSDALRRAHHLAIDCFPAIDVVFATPEDVANAASLPSPFLHSILSNGKSLFLRET